MQTLLTTVLLWNSYLHVTEERRPETDEDEQLLDLRRYFKMVGKKDEFENWKTKKRRRKIKNKHAFFCSRVHTLNINYRSG